MGPEPNRVLGERLDVIKSFGPAFPAATQIRITEQDSDRPLGPISLR
jgi:hypothetical protein